MGIKGCRGFGLEQAEPEMVGIADAKTSNGSRNYVHHARHHERVVEQILTYHGGSRAVKVDRGDV